jgi:hypothetical protein
VRPDGHVAWVGDMAGLGLTEALTTWFGPPASSGGGHRAPGRGHDRHLG